MGEALVVVRPFGQCKIGAMINNPATIRTTLASAHAHYVVRVAAVANDGAKSQRD
jgi:hypothetical protein